MSRYNFTLFHIWDIPIRINISLVVFLPVLAYLIGGTQQIAAYSALITAVTPATVDPAALSGPGDRWVIGIITAVGLFASVTFHELGHSWVAMRYDIEVESITLWLLGGLASLSSMPDQWQREFWIALAGPASSLLLAGGCLLAISVAPQSGTLLIYSLGFLVIINVVLAVFNMLPAFPMDGGRVLRALLARNRSYVSATRTAARIGVGFAFLFAILGALLFSPLMFLLALFVYIAATSESQTVLISALFSGLTVADLLGDQEPVPFDTPVAEVLDRLFEARRSDLPVVDENGDIIGVVTGRQLVDVPASEYETTAVGSLVRRDLPRIDGATSAADGFHELIATRSNVAVVEWEGEPVGLISRADFSAALELRRETTPF